MALPKVFFDSNTGSDTEGYWLGFEQSRLDLARLGDRLQDGTRVVIYMPDEFEMTATLRFAPDERIWRAVPEGGTIRYLDQSV